MLNYSKSKLKILRKIHTTNPLNIFQALLCCSHTGNFTGIRYVCVPPPEQQTVALSGWRLQTERQRLLRVWRSNLYFSCPADCQEKAPLWLLLKRERKQKCHYVLNGNEWRCPFLLLGLSWSCDKIMYQFNFFLTSVQCGRKCVK